MYNIVHFRGTERTNWALTDLKSLSTQEKENLSLMQCKFVETWNKTDQDGTWLKKEIRHYSKHLPKLPGFHF